MWNLLLLLLERIGLIVTLAFLLTRSKLFRKLLEHKLDLNTKIKISLIFGLFGIVGTYTGVTVHTETSQAIYWVTNIISNEEAIANSRVVGVAIGGLLGGPLVGFGAGLIAGLHRITLGGFTGISCAVATVIEGTIAGIVGKRLKKGRIISAKVALFTGMGIELLQMVLILLLARPFPKALALVEIIGVPMIIANGIGIAIFVAIIRSVIEEEDKIEAEQAHKTLEIAEQTLFYLRKGLTTESATETAKILLKLTGVTAVSITDREKILSHVGLGDDHHKPNTLLLTEVTKKVINTGILQIANSKNEIQCSKKNCPLQAAIIVPLTRGELVIGSLKFYFSNPKVMRPVDKELAKGLGKLLSHQLELAYAEEQAQLVASAEIKALQAQINPHFLFNSLNAIQSLIRTEPLKARKLLTQLGNFFRQNLNASLHETIPLIQEINHVASYLDIQKARFPDRLEIKYDIEEIGEVLIPPLTLQPLVENALQHGLRPKDSKGMIKISAKKKGDHVLLSVIDNGAGIAKERIKSLLTNRVVSVNGTGIGLYNVHQRLINLFGPQAGLKIKSIRGIGTKISFVIPLR